MRTIKKILSCLLLLNVFTAFTLLSCPYNSVQIRVQPDLKTHWSKNTSATVGAKVHVGVFKNGWGAPIDAGGVQVYAVQGSQWTPINLSGWETWYAKSFPTSVTFHAYCSGPVDTATANWTNQIDILSYVKPGGKKGSKHSVISAGGNPWRTFSNSNGNVKERLPGFYITKGNVHPKTGVPGLFAWNFEQMIYDRNWLYLVRDTSWTARCQDNYREAGMLQFTYENGKWLRGGRHFPRYLNKGQSKHTGSKYIQGVEKKMNPRDKRA